MLERDRDRRFGVERNPPGEQLVEDDPNGVEIRRCADRVALRLLRGQVLRGAHDRACLRHVGRTCPRDPEIGHLDVVGVVLDHHVVGLEVAVDDAAAVGEPRRLEDLDRDLDRTDRIERRLLADHLLERAAGQVLHHDVVGVVVGPAVIHADDVGVLQAGGGLGLAAEALDESRILGETAVQQLQRDLASELLILGEEDIGHAARPEAGDHAVAPVDERAWFELSHCRKEAASSRHWQSGRRRCRRNRCPSCRS